MSNRRAGILKILVRANLVDDLIYPYPIIAIGFVREN